MLPDLDTFGEAGVLVGTGVPLTLLIDADGREVARKLGAVPWDEPAIQDLIRLYLPAQERINESKT